MIQQHKPHRVKSAAWSSLLALCLLTAVVGCETVDGPRTVTPQPDTADGDGGDSSGADQAAAEKEQRLKAQRAAVEQQALESVGEPCELDRDCALYLRCFEGACKVPPAVDGDEVSDAPVVVIQTSKGEAQFFMEVALSFEQQRRGLMFRPRMSDKWSMLFVYERDRANSFWMKNTLIPLDMVFINDANEVVGVVPEAEPLTTTSRSVGAPSRYVLEINAGLAAQFGIEAGSKVQFVRLPEL